MRTSQKNKPTSFRFTPEVLAALKRISDSKGKSQISVVEWLILDAREKLTPKEDKHGLDIVNSL